MPHECAFLVAWKRLCLYCVGKSKVLQREIDLNKEYIYIAFEHNIIHNQWRQIFENSDRNPNSNLWWFHKINFLHKLWRTRYNTQSRYEMSDIFNKFLQWVITHSTGFIRLSITSHVDCYHSVINFNLSFQKFIHISLFPTFRKWFTRHMIP